MHSWRISFFEYANFLIASTWSQLIYFFLISILLEMNEETCTLKIKINSSPVMRRVPVDEGMSADKLGKCFFIFWKIPRIRPMELRAKIFSRKAISWLNIEFQSCTLGCCKRSSSGFKQKTNDNKWSGKLVTLLSVTNDRLKNRNWIFS